MSTIAFIPARCGSKSIRLKNIKLFCGKPLIYWNLLALENTPAVDKVVLATDCDAIENIAYDFGFSKTVVYRRDSANANDTSSTESVMLEYIQKEKLKESDVFILVQATSPLTRAIDFIRALQKLKEENGNSLLTCVRQKRFFWKENGAVKNILSDKNRLSGKIVVHEMEDFTAVELDEPDDWIIAEMLMRKHILNKEKKIPRIKLFLTDVDGVLTDAGMYYSENGDELKKFNTHDGKGMELLRNAGLKTGIITSENTKIVERRAQKLKIDYLSQGRHGKGKLSVAKDFCDQAGVSLAETAYIGDDINCLNLLTEVGMAACPANALSTIKKIPGILLLERKGGEGVVREFAEYILRHNAQF